MIAIYPEKSRGEGNNPNTCRPLETPLTRPKTKLFIVKRIYFIEIFVRGKHFEFLNFRIDLYIDNIRYKIIYTDSKRNARATRDETYCRHIFVITFIWRKTKTKNDEKRVKLAR